MIGKEETFHVGAAIIILSLLFSIMNLNVFLYTLVAIFFVIVLNESAKKFSARYFDCETETKIWQVQRYWFKPSNYFKKPKWAGIFLPLITGIITFGHVVWTACLTFDVKPGIHRTAKRHGYYSYAELNENHIGYIAASGIFANLIFAAIGYFIGITLFTKLSILYAFWNMIPISDLDGNKIFFGNIVLWSFLATLVMIGIGYVVLIV